ncbi:hypothetical protein [Streptomyces xanthophaeus]|uniref:hypothetical protein n=1 Tax=Streptomyces xanthophaeus TaxID=67385 RepID=UPI0026484160|nr:hypothetical protein [Streptomyces xanthophaeus]WKD30759.1 hypothetical protein KO717_01430 [Streptomyces xanthophaeus]
MSESKFRESAPAPVFVDQSGLRGRVLRGLCWPVSVLGAVLAVAMGSSLIGVQADAPAMGIPVQPSRQAAPPPSPVPSLSPGPSSSSSAPRTATRSATPQAKTAATTPKTAATTTKTMAATPKNAAATAKNATTAPRGTAPPGRPAKHP